MKNTTDMITPDTHKDPTQENLLDYASDRFLWVHFRISFSPTGVFWFNYHSIETGTERRWEITKKEFDLIVGIWNLYRTTSDGDPIGNTVLVREQYVDRAKRRIAEFKAESLIA
jgi:hypothetical protein